MVQMLFIYKQILQLNRINKKRRLNRNKPFLQQTENMHKNILLITILLTLTVLSQANGQQYLNQLATYSDVIHCMPKCLQCQNGPNSCTKCTDGFYCCNWACGKCQNQIKCTACKDGFQLDQQKNICVMQDSCFSALCAICDPQQTKCTFCIDNYFLNTEMLTCDICPPKCLQCTNNYQCLVCSPRTYWSDGACRACGQNCLKCKNSTFCQYCDPTYYLNLNGKCQKCIQHCNNCTTKQQCTQCVKGYFFDSTLIQCVPCMSPCIQCKSQEVCQVCPTNYFLNQTTKQCDQCSDIKAHCITCQAVQNIDFNKNDSKLIIWKQNINYGADKVICKVCMQKYYLNDDNSCFPCVPNCLICKVVQSCENCSQFYFINDKKQCQYCGIYHCLQCTNMSLCRLCQNGYYWNNATVGRFACQRCTIGCDYCDQFGCKQCERGYFQKNGNCYRCDPSCSLCRDSASSCQICLTGFFKPNLAGGLCFKCPQPCLQCKNLTFCSHCMPGYYLHNNVCKKCQSPYCDQCKRIEDQPQQISRIALNDLEGSEKCLKCTCGYFIKDQGCQKCIDGCRYCQDNATCYICFRQHTLTDDKKCVVCPQNCVLCDDMKHQKGTLFCLNCKQGYVVDQSNGKCFKCPQNCVMCVSQYCLDCKEGYYHKQVTQSSNICAKCEYPCKSCEQAKQCLSCVTGYYLNVDDKCLKCQVGCQQCVHEGCILCDIGYNLNFSSMACQKCKVDKCSKCQNSLALCDSCEDGYKSYSLLSKTNENLNSSTSMCYRCDESIQGCKSCESPYSCNQCFNGLTLQQDGVNCIKQTGYLGFWITIGILALIVSVLIGVIWFKNRKSKRKIHLVEQKQNLNDFKEYSYSINSQQQIDSSSLRKSILSSKD